MTAVDLPTNRNLRFFKIAQAIHDLFDEEDFFEMRLDDLSEWRLCWLSEALVKNGVDIKKMAGLLQASCNPEKPEKVFIDASHYDPAVLVLRGSNSGIRGRAVLLMLVATL